MRGRIFRGFVVLAMAAMLIWGDASPALAAETSWSVTNPNADGSFATTAGTLTLVNTDTGVTTSCSSAPLYGTLPTAAGVHELGYISHSEATDCTSSGGSPAVVFIAGEVPLAGRSYDALTGRATVDGVMLIDSVVSQPGCDYYVSGTLRMTYTNSSSELVIDDTSFTVTYATGSGCGGVAAEGDTVGVTGRYTLTPAITLVAAPPRFTVTGGNADGGFTTTQSGTTVHTLGDLNTGNHSRCSDATVAGRIPNGSDVPAAGIGSVTSASLGRCTQFPDNDGVFTVTPVNLPWRLDAVSYVATDGGYVSGSIANFELSVSGPGCSFSVTNTPYATDWRYGEFNGTPDVLLINLQRAEITNVQGCGGGFNNGDRASYSNAYAVSPATLQITGR